MQQQPDPRELALVRAVDEARAVSRARQAVVTSARDSERAVRRAALVHGDVLPSWAGASLTGIIRAADEQLAYAIADEQAALRALSAYLDAKIAEALRPVYTMEG